MEFHVSGRIVHALLKKPPAKLISHIGPEENYV
jgi:hypothetical protein